MKSDTSELMVEVIQLVIAFNLALIRRVAEAEEVEPELLYNWDAVNKRAEKEETE